jgi:hypothetical protein
VLILGLQHIVVLEMPKTGSLALRAMLALYTLPASDRAARHIGYDGFLRKHAPHLAAGFGRTPQTVAVVRDPLGRMQSWYRYRRRDKVKGKPASTHGISFDYFVRAYLDGVDKQMTNVGRQDRFVGWTGQFARVDHLFDYKQLPLMEAFFSNRMGTPLTLPQKNISPKSALTDYSLDPATLARFHSQNLAEFELYHAVAGAGHLMRPGVSS